VTGTSSSSSSSGSAASSSGGGCVVSLCNKCVGGGPSCSDAGACQCCVGSVCLPD
jgi:hypothetical protein